MKRPLDPATLPASNRQLPDIEQVQPGSQEEQDQAAEDDSKDDGTVERVLRYVNAAPIDGVFPCRAWFHCVDLVQPDSDLCSIHATLVPEVNAAPMNASNSADRISRGLDQKVLWKRPCEATLRDIKLLVDAELETAADHKPTVFQVALKELAPIISLCPMTSAGPIYRLRICRTVTRSQSSLATTRRTLNATIKDKFKPPRHRVCSWAKGYGPDSGIFDTMLAGNTDPFVLGTVQFEENPSIQAIDVESLFRRLYI